MKKIIVALAITAIASFAFAQEPPHRMPFHDMKVESGAIADSLGLAADQKVQWEAIHQQLDATMSTLKLQIGPAERQLESLANASNPDATAVGKQFLALHALQQQIKAAHDAAKSKIDAILTPDQKAKFDAMHQEMMEHGPMMMKMRHPEPGVRE
ncbi:MAG: Spy/CpxP family protein refolding chaperone [Thermoanaerobaculia bacterium]